MGHTSRWVAAETYDKLAPVPAAQAPVVFGEVA